MRGEYSLADIKAVTDGNGGFGDTGSWWIIIIIILFGWGRNGFGGYGNSGSGAMDNYVLNSDFATLQRQLSDGFSDLKQTGSRLGDGICNLGYTQAQLINGVNTTVLQGDNAINTNIMGGVNTLQGAIKDCCCTTQRSIDSVNFNNAQNTSLITNAITLNGRDIIDNMNANYRALHDEIVANRIEDKNAQIASMQNEINRLQLCASQTAQNTYLVDKLSPKCPIPAYITCNPYASCNCGNCGTSIQ